MIKYKKCGLHLGVFIHTLLSGQVREHSVEKLQSQILAQTEMEELSYWKGKRKAAIQLTNLKD